MLFYSELAFLSINHLSVINIQYDALFQVENVMVRKLCYKRVITAVNGALPGPTIQVSEGDTLVVHVFNKSPYNVTIHW